LYALTRPSGATCASARPTTREGAFSGRSDSDSLIAAERDRSVHIQANPRLPGFWLTPVMSSCAALRRSVSERLRWSDSTRRLAIVTLMFAALTALMTAPLLWRIADALPDHGDAYFSVWRLAWIAHQLPLAPARLFDANIFSPAQGTLLLSDAMVLLGLAGTLPIQLGVHPVVVHNSLFLLGFVLSGVCAFVLARSLTGETGPSMLAGIIFAFAPYKFGHFGHLELQWACWMALALWAAHRLFDRGLLRHGVLLGLLLALQGYCSLYYLALLIPVLITVLAVLAVLADRRPALICKRRLIGLSVAAAIAALLLGPYLFAYFASGSAHLPRSAEEVAEFSASLSSYLHVPPANRVYANLRSDVEADELSLFPGIVTLGFAALAFRGRRSRVVLAYAAGLLVAFLLSLGPRGGLFAVLRLVLPPLANLRAPARAGVLVLLSLAVLAAFGAREWMSRRARPTAAAGLAVACLVCLGEYWSVPMQMMRPILRAPLAYEWLARQPADSVVLTLPMSLPDRVDCEPLNDYLSIYHWRHLVNGYSGFSPPEYRTTEALLRSFPDQASIRHLRTLSVSYVVLNASLYRPEDYGRLAERLASDPNFGPPLEFRDVLFRAVVFPLRPEGPREPAGGNRATADVR
jgi:hypothetical protein